MARTIKELTQLAVKTMNSYQKAGVPPWDCEIATMDLHCQVGDLSRLVMYLKGKRLGKTISENETKDKISDELADIICDTLFIAHDLGIDLEKAFDAMLESDKRKVALKVTSDIGVLVRSAG